MKELIKKQEEEFDKEFVCSIQFGGFPREQILGFIKKVRKETAEMVCDEMIGPISDLRKEEVGDPGEMMWDNGYDNRIKEEKEMKKQIIKEL